MLTSNNSKILDCFSKRIRRDHSHAQSVVSWRELAKFQSFLLVPLNSAWLLVLWKSYHSPCIGVFLPNIWFRNYNCCNV